MNGPGNGHYVTPAMVEKQVAALRQYYRFVQIERELGIERKGDADRINENLNALDRYAGEVLAEKEGGAGCNPEL